MRFKVSQKKVEIDIELRTNNKNITVRPVPLVFEVQTSHFSISENIYSTVYLYDKHENREKENHSYEMYVKDSQKLKLLTCTI